MFQIRLVGKGGFAWRTSGTPALRLLRRCLLARGPSPLRVGVYFSIADVAFSSAVACNTGAARASLIGEPRRKDGFTNYGDGATDTSAQHGRMGRPQRPMVLRLADGGRLRERPEGSALRHGPATRARAHAGAGNGQPAAPERTRALGAPGRGAGHDRGAPAQPP